jgi:hypothetical protein
MVSEVSWLAHGFSFANLLAFDSLLKENMSTPRLVRCDQTGGQMWAHRMDMAV